MPTSRIGRYAEKNASGYRSAERNFPTQRIGGKRNGRPFIVKPPKRGKRLLRSSERSYLKNG